MQRKHSPKHYEPILKIVKDFFPPHPIKKKVSVRFLFKVQVDKEVTVILLVTQKYNFGYNWPVRAHNEDTCGGGVTQ